MGSETYTSPLRVPLSIVGATMRTVECSESPLSSTMRATAPGWICAIEWLGSSARHSSSPSRIRRKVVTRLDHRPDRGRFPRDDAGRRGEDPGLRDLHLQLRALGDGEVDLAEAVAAEVRRVCTVSTLKSR